MSKFDDFSWFIRENVIFPLVISFVSCMIPVCGTLVFHAEWMWAVYIAFASCAVTAVWLVLFLVCLVCERILEARWEKEYEREMLND